MLKMMNRKQGRDNKGFSLVELIIAIAILIILSGLIIGSVLRYVQKSKQAADFNDADAIATSLKMWMSEPANEKRLRFTSDQVGLGVLISTPDSAKPTDAGVIGPDSVGGVQKYDLVYLGDMKYSDLTKQKGKNAGLFLETLREFMPEYSTIRQSGYYGYAVYIDSNMNVGYYLLKQKSDFATCGTKFLNSKNRASTWNIDGNVGR